MFSKSKFIIFFLGIGLASVLAMQACSKPGETGLASSTSDENEGIRARTQTKPYGYLVGYIVNGTNSAASMQSIQSWAGVKPDMDGGTMVINGYYGGIAPGYQAQMTIPMLSFSDAPDGGLNLNDMSKAATGGYDSYYQNMAHQLANSGAAVKSVRFGWECNGNWYPWSVGGKGGINQSTANYKATFRRMASIFRSELPGVLIEWNTNWATASGYGAGNPEDYFPGSDVVDVVSMDFYESNQGNWAATQSGGGNGARNLDWLASFAKANNLKVGLSEWGAANDDGSYIASAAKWMNSLGTLFVYSNYSAYAPADQFVASGQNSIDQSAWYAAWGAGAVITTPPPVATATPSPVSSAGKSAVVEIVHVNSGKCIDDPGFSTSLGTQFEIWNCTGGANQQFKATLNSDGTLTFVNSNSGLCLDVQGNSTSNLTHIEQWTCNGQLNQKFKPFAAGSGNYNLKPANANLSTCIDINGNSTASGALAQEYICNGTGAQIFAIKILSGGLSLP